MRISATLAGIVGAGVGLVAAGATYAAAAGHPADTTPVSNNAPQAVTTTVDTEPTDSPTCSAHAVLKNGVCVVTLDRTTTVAPREDSTSEDSEPTTSTATRTHTEEAEPEDDATENAQGDDQGEDDSEHAESDDQGEHAESGDDQGDDSGEHSDDSHEDDGGSDD